MITFSKKKIALALSTAVLASFSMAATAQTSIGSYDRTSTQIQAGSSQFKAFDTQNKKAVYGQASISAYAGSSSNYAKPFTICYKLVLRNTYTGKNVNEGTTQCYNSRLSNGKHIIEDILIKDTAYSSVLSSASYRYLLLTTSTPNFETRKFGNFWVSFDAG